MYYLLHRNQLHISALFMVIFRLIMRNLISSYTRFSCVVYSGEVKGEGWYEIWHALCRVGGGFWYFLF